MAQSIPINASIQRDHLVCLVCGEKYKMMKGHLRLEHRLTPAAYRSLFGLPESYPMMPPGFREIRSHAAKSAARKRRAAAGQDPAQAVEPVRQAARVAFQDVPSDETIALVRETPLAVSVSYTF